MAIKRGEKTRLAKDCGVTRQAVDQWFNPKYKKIGSKTTRNANRIVRLLNSGFSMKEVAKQVGLSPRALSVFANKFFNKTYSLNEKALLKVADIIQEK